MYYAATIGLVIFIFSFLKINILVNHYDYAVTIMLATKYLTPNYTTDGLNYPAARGEVLYLYAKWALGQVLFWGFYQLIKLNQALTLWAETFTFQFYGLC